MADSNIQDSQKKKQSRKQWIIENVMSLALALLIVFMIRSSIVEAFKIPSGSMIPTLLVGDHIFVNKFAYGIKIPFSDFITDHPIYAIKRDPPQRGDIIVFLFPGNESLYYIKRVIGVPGDTVEVKNKALYINHEMIQRDAVPPIQAEKTLKYLDEPRYNMEHTELYTEHLGPVNHPVDHAMMLDKANYIGESNGPVTVPAENLFVMGDNRDFSNDSRFWGFVPYRNVKGKAMVVWMSLWISFTDNQYIFRPDRIGTVLH